MTARESLRRLEELGTLRALYRDAELDSRERPDGVERLRALDTEFAREASESAWADGDGESVWQAASFDPRWG